MTPKEKAIKHLRKYVIGLQNAHSYWIASESIDIAIKEQDKVSRKLEQKRIIKKLFSTEESRYYGVKLTHKKLKEVIGN